MTIKWLCCIQLLNKIIMNVDSNSKPNMSKAESYHYAKCMKGN